MMVTFMTGMMRSGSTWSYNVAVMLFELQCTRNGKKGTIGYGDGKELDEILAKPGDKVLKSHFLSPLAESLIKTGESRAIHTVRHPYACVASRQAFKPEEKILDSIDYITHNVATIALLHDRPNVMLIRYEDFAKDNTTGVGMIADRMRIEVSKEHINAIVESTSLARHAEIVKDIKNIDKLTNLHKNHITGSKFSDLSDEDQALTKKCLSMEADFLGYER